MLLGVGLGWGVWLLVVGCGWGLGGWCDVSVFGFDYMVGLRFLDCFD